MSQIISIHIGGCGVKVGLKFWEKVEESKKQTEKHSLNAYYSKLYYETQKQGEKPRAIFLDTDIRSNYLVSDSDINFDRSSIYAYGSSCRNLYSEGCYGEGRDISDFCNQMVRKQVQKCDCLSGFMVMRSPAGGAGSGLGQNIINTTRDYFPSNIIQQFKIMPGLNQKYSCENFSTLQVYNTILSNKCTIINSDLVYLFENKKVQKIFQNKKMQRYDIKDVNNYIGKCINRHIKAYTEPGMLNTNQRKRAVNLVSYPRVKHLCGSLTEMHKGEDGDSHFRSALNFQNRLVSNSRQQDDYILAAHVDINDITVSEKSVSQIVKKWLGNTKNKFVDWIAHSVHLSYSKQPKNENKSTWILFNGRANIQWGKKLSEAYSQLARRKHSFHHYTQLGMDEMQFVQAQSGFNDFLSEYVVYDGSFDPEDYDEPNYE